MNDLIENIDRLHTTDLGKERIKKNLHIDIDDVLKWCRTKILNKNARFEKSGKNWYIIIENFRITVNAGSYTIITAHRIR